MYKCSCPVFQNVAPCKCVQIICTSYSTFCSWTFASAMPLPVLWMPATNNQSVNFCPFFAYLLWTRLWQNTEICWISKNCGEPLFKQKPSWQIPAKSSLCLINQQSGKSAILLHNPAKQQMLSNITKYSIFLKVVAKPFCYVSPILFIVNWSNSCSV